MRRKGKLYVILSLILVVGLMIVGYAAYNQHLSISETSKIDSNFNILITNIETKEVGGEAINESDPTYNGLEANFNITFNKKNDYIEYNVEVSNKGSIEAYLNQIKIENENSKVVNMSYRDINIGEELLVGESKTFVVRIEYKGGSGSGEITLNLDYSADNSPGEIIVPEENYKVIYNTEENGGEKGEIEEKYYKKGEEIDLKNVGKKEGYTFVGWNINKDSKEAIKTLQMGEEEITLYAIYKKEIEARYKIGDGIKEIPIEKETCEIYNKEETCKINLPNIESIKAKEGRVIDGWYKDNTKVENNTQIIRENSIYEIKAYPDIPANIEINTSTLSNSIRVVTNVINIEEVKGIERYEYSIDNSEYIESNNTYTFDNLEHNTEHTIKVRVTTKGNIQTEKEITVRTLEIATPTFSEEIEGVVKITYPRECVERYTCTYIKDNGEETQITKNPEEVIFGTSGTIIAKVTDGTNYITSSAYTVERTNLYVSNNGNDTNGYGTKEAPYKTINKAYDSSSLTNESTIYVMDDITQTETALFDENKTITLTSYSENDTVNSIIKGKVLDDNLIRNESGTLSLNNVILNGNNLLDSAPGLFMEEGTKLNLNENAIIQYFKNKNSCGGIRAGINTIVNINGGIIRYNEALYDAGLAVTKNGIVNFSAGEISHNKSTDSTSGTAAGIALNGSTFTMTGGKIINNEAVRNAGGLYVGNHADGTTGEAHLLGGIIQNNKANNHGGAIYVYKGILNIDGVTITDNTASSYGGAICNDGTLNLNSGTISNNTGADGGAIYNYRDTSIININNITISDNTASNFGGGIHNNGTITITSGTISKNTSTSGGGGIYSTSGKITINGSSIFNNISNAGGGGIFNTGSAVLEIKNGKIYGNTATTGGGGILNYNVLNISGGDIYSNKAEHGSGVGGGSGSQITMTGGTIRNNSASLYGGGVEVYAQTSYKSTFILNGGTIKNNTAASTNGGIIVSGAGTYTRKSGIVCGNKPTNSYETSATCPS